MQYSVCGKCLHLMHNHIDKRERDVIIEVGKCKENGCSCTGYGKVAHDIITIDDLKAEYKIGESIEFSIKIKGFGSSSGIPDLWIRQLDKTSIEKFEKLPKNELSYLIEPHGHYLHIVWHKPPGIAKSSNLEDYERIVQFQPEKELPLRIQEMGLYELAVIVNPNEVKQRFEIR